MLIYEGNLHQKKIGALSQLGAEKITFPPKRGWRTYGQTDICIYRVASLQINLLEAISFGSWFAYLSPIQWDKNRNNRKHFSIRVKSVSELCWYRQKKPEIYFKKTLLPRHKIGAKFWFGRFFSSKVDAYISNVN